MIIDKVNVEKHDQRYVVIRMLFFIVEIQTKQSRFRFHFLERVFEMIYTSSKQNLYAN